MKKLSEKEMVRNLYYIIHGRAYNEYEDEKTCDKCEYESECDFQCMKT